MSTKEIQGKLWSIEPHSWAQYFEPWFLPMYKKVLEQLELTEKDFLLDAGCGSGLFSNLAIETGAEVIGVDASIGLLGVARRCPLHLHLLKYSALVFTHRNPSDRMPLS
jgi:tRNA/tmRNA/rRNA uracil-C5-methylase (TrmA/RlmC/RlmD family)